MNDSIFKSSHVDAARARGTARARETTAVRTRAMPATRRARKAPATAPVSEDAPASDPPTATSAGDDDDDASRDDESDSDDIEIELREDIDVVAEHERAEAEREEKEKEAAEARAEAAAAAAATKDEEAADGEEDEGEAMDALGVGSRGVVDVYSLSNYTFGTKRARGEKDATAAERLLRMRAQYEKEGKRRSVGAICMVSQHRTPHVLLLQITPTSFKLPGGRLRAGEGDVEGLARKMRNKLQPERDDGLEQYEFDIGDQVATWYRTSYEPQMYPYLPAHITKPKEEYRMFVAHLPEKCYFAVPKNLKLLAVPLFELYGNPGKYGAEIASIPHLLSRYRLNLE